MNIPKDMKPWLGGKTAPEDYAVGRAVLGRDGNLYGQHPKAYLVWQHGRPGTIDIIAYTPLPPPPAGADDGIA